MPKKKEKSNKKIRKHTNMNPIVKERRFKKMEKRTTFLVQPQFKTDHSFCVDTWSQHFMSF